MRGRLAAVFLDDITIPTLKLPPPFILMKSGGYFLECIGGNNFLLDVSHTVFHFLISAFLSTETASQDAI